MKKIFAIIMSFQLILMPVAFAADSGNYSIPGTEESSGVKNDAYRNTGTGSTGGMDFYVSQIAGIGTGMLGASIITQCLEGLKTPSIATFMAGSLVHIASEILGAKKKNDRNKKKISELELKEEDLVKKGDSSQLESLKAFLVEEEDTNEFLRNRKQWMIAVDVIYAAAVGLALAEEFYGLAAGNTTAKTACTAVMTTAATSACGAAAIPVGGVAAATAAATAAPITLSIIPVVTTAATPVATAATTAASLAATAAIPPFVGAAAAAAAATALAEAIPVCVKAAVDAGVLICVADYNAKMEAIKANVVGHSTARIGMKANCKKDTSCIAAGEAVMGVMYAACQEAPVDGGASMFSWTGLLSMAYGFGSGQLNKDGGAIASYGSMGVSLLTAFVPAVSATVSKLYNMPIPRSITFGALGIMSGINTAGLAKREEISNRNIVKIKNAISQFETETEGSDAGVTLAVADKDPTKPKKKPGLKALVVNKAKNCISNSGGKFDVSEKACGRSLKLKKIGFGKINIPVLNNVANMSNDMAQALADGDEAKAYGIAGDIGQMAARVKQATAELKTKYNEEQKKNNKPQLDFNKKIAEQVASLNKSMQQAAASKNVNLASMSSGDAPADSTDKATDAPVVTAAFIPPAVEPTPDLTLLGDSGEELAAEAPVAASAEQSLDDFESSEQDVSKKPEVSIFKQLSNRYILNYTKIFDRKKSAEAVPEETKKN